MQSGYRICTVLDTLVPVKDEPGIQMKLGSGRFKLEVHRITTPVQFIAAVTRVTISKQNKIYNLQAYVERTLLKLMGFSLMLSSVICPIAWYCLLQPGWHGTETVP